MADTLSLPSRIAGMYRRALRLTREIAGQRRRRICVFRTREMLQRAIADRAHAESHLMDADLYLDNIEAQARHLNSLDPTKLIVPLELYHPHTPTHKGNRVILDSCTARRRSEEERRANVKEVLGGKLWQGPEPSWIRRRREQLQEQGEDPADGDGGQA